MGALCMPHTRLCLMKSRMSRQKDCLHNVGQRAGRRTVSAGSTNHTQQRRQSHAPVASNASRQPPLHPPAAGLQCSCCHRQRQPRRRTHSHAQQGSSHRAVKGCGQLLARPDSAAHAAAWRQTRRRGSKPDASLETAAQPSQLLRPAPQRCAGMQQRLQTPAVPPQHPLQPAGGSVTELVGLSDVCLRDSCSTLTRQLT